MLSALRMAIPASLDNSSQTRTAFEQFERGLIAKATGTTPQEHKRWAPSKRRAPAQSKNVAPPLESQRTNSNTAATTANPIKKSTIATAPDQSPPNGQHHGPLNAHSAAAPSSSTGQTTKITKAITGGP